MWTIDLAQAGLSLVLASLAAALGGWVLTRGGRGSDSRGDPDQASDPVFLFNDTALMSANAAARLLVGQTARDRGWEALRDTLQPRFPDFPAAPPGSGGHVLNPTDPLDPARVEIDVHGKTTRVTISNDDQDGSDAWTRDELRQLRRAMNDAPYPAWRVDDAGRVTWFNSAYADLFATVRGGSPAVDVHIFGATHAGKAPGSTVRASIQPHARDDMIWFDVTMRADGENRLFYATDVSAIVKAEIAQRNFVQTLAKTFAQLSFGLAIFDRNRQLALFNPALVDLTGLGAEFLSARPKLSTFFDSLRENRTMPEPKNYNSWRDRLADLDAGATQGTYQETWSLANGATYKVSGRPHPDGAIAFLFEDISAEVGLTRRFRADLELAQAVLDQIDDAIAVFSSTGKMKGSNRAYRRLWKTDPDACFAEISVVDAMRAWHQVGGPSPVWGELRDFVLGRDDRVAWSAQINPVIGPPLLCLVDPIASGATLIRFRPGELALKDVTLVPAPAAD